MALGYDEEQLSSLNDAPNRDDFNEQEKLVIALADAMTTSHVDDALFQRLQQHFTNAQIVQLTGLIALENMRARWNHALGIEV